MFECTCTICLIYNVTNQKKLICHLKSVSYTQYWWDLMDLWVYSKYIIILALQNSVKSSLNIIITFIAIISSLCRYIPTSGRKCFQFLKFSLQGLLGHVFSKILARSPWELQHQTSIKMHFYLCHNNWYPWVLIKSVFVSCCLQDAALSRL